MSIAAIRAALEQGLAAISPSLETAYENTQYAPTAGTPYQRVALLRNEPDNRVHGAAMFFEVGILHVLLCYPPGTGPAAAEARAEAVRAAFKRGVRFEQSGVIVLITDTPKVSGGYQDEGRYCIPIHIKWQAQIVV